MPRPQLSLQAGSVRGSLNLTFQSQIGTAYELLFSTTLAGPMEPLERVTGDGHEMQRTAAIVANKNGFYALSIVSP